MAGKRLDTMQIRELLRHLRATPSNRQVHRDTGIHRDTISHYRQWAKEQGLLDPEKPLPSLEELQQLVEETLNNKTPPPQTVSTVEPYRDLVQNWHNQQVEGRTIWYRLKEKGYKGGLSSVYRFLAALERENRARALPNQVVVRVERPPGEEAQVDFGEVGYWYDPVKGCKRKVLLFVMSLSYSRHMYAEFVYHQDISTWVELHRRAFEYFGGVPQRVVLDNLKAAITKTSWDGHDPQVSISYRECAEHYGFLIAPCRPRKPEHKGKVESNIHYVKRSFVAGQTFEALGPANQALLEWCQKVAGERQHGTTKQKPLVRFAEERDILKPLPTSPYQVAKWKQVKVHRDCHLTFEGSYYSVPFRMVGQTVRVRGGAGDVKIYDQHYALVATHTRAGAPGERLTHPEHLPSQKLAGLTRRREEVLVRAQQIGPATEKVVRNMLEDRVVDRLHTAGSLVNLAQRADIGEARLEAACQRAVTFGEYSYRTIQGILKQRLEQEKILPEIPPPAVAAQAGRYKADTGLPDITGTGKLQFERSARELLGHLFQKGMVGLAFAGSWISIGGGRLWN